MTSGYIIQENNINTDNRSLDMNQILGVEENQLCNTNVDQC